MPTVKKSDKKASSWILLPPMHQIVSCIPPNFKLHWPKQCVEHHLAILDINSSFQILIFHGEISKEGVLILFGFVHKVIELFFFHFTALLFINIIFSHESDSTITNVCLSVCHKSKPINSLKSSSFIIHSSSFIILHSSFILPSFCDL